MLNKKYFVILIFLMFIIIIADIIFVNNYNKPENVEKRAIKYCIHNNKEYRETIGSNGEILKQCKIDGSFIDVVKFYQSNNGK